jgi:uncharacterized membrane protein YqjE
MIIASTFVQILHTRVALLTLELREEIHRRKQALLLGILAAASLHMATLGCTALLVALFWDTHRIEVITILSAAYLACALGLGLFLRARLAHQPVPFEASRAELGRDFQAMGSPLP